MPRQAMTDDERRRVREYFVSQQRSCTHGTVVAWFRTEFGRGINQSQVSKILSNKFLFLDRPVEQNERERKKHKSCQWPDLENALFQWQQGMQKKGISLTGEHLTTKAEEFWGRLPKYHGLPPPSFSVGWLDNFKKRHKIKHYKTHGEAGSVDQSALEMELVKLRTKTDEYALCDIYNMDETGVYWRQTPDKGLATAQLPGHKMDKSRVTLVLCTNADGSDKVPLWIIGTAQNPRCFKKLNRALLGCEYRANKTAWMNGEIMIDWLERFDRRMRGRRVLLLLDNFSAHDVGTDAVSMQNVIVQYLPPNTTSVCQPLDQGVIYAWKGHYRRLYTQWCLRQWEKDQDPKKEMNLLYTMRWAVEAWNLEVQPSTCMAGFQKGKILSLTRYGTSSAADAVMLAARSAETQVEEEVQASIHSMARDGRIQEMMHLSTFLNPTEERVDDPDDELMEHIVASYQHVDEEPTDEAVNPIDPILVSFTDALTGLDTLLTFNEQAAGDDPSTVDFLRRLQRSLIIGERQKQADRPQGSLDTRYQGKVL